MILQWKHSPPHNAIMLTRDFKINSFGCAFRYQPSEVFTRNNLLKYNPQLLNKIESILPDYFTRYTNSDSSLFAVWSTGNFMRSTNVLEEMEWVKRATATHNADG